MIYKVQIQVDMGQGILVNHHMEQVVDTPDEARDFGETSAYLMNAFNGGFGEADLSNE